MLTVEDGEGLPRSGDGDVKEPPFFFPRFFSRFCLPVAIEKEHVRVFHAFGTMDRRKHHSLPEAVLPATFSEALIEPFDRLGDGKLGVRRLGLPGGEEFQEESPPGISDWVSCCLLQKAVQF